MTDAMGKLATIPSLEISGPGCEPWCYELTADRPTTVGRLADVNDIVLAPDADRLVTGRHHCTIAFEHEPSRGWHVIDTRSRNGTFLRQGTSMLEVRGTQALIHGDVICILARLSQTGPPVYWELFFDHREGTTPIAAVARLEYDWAGARLYRIERTRRVEIGNLRPQVHLLLRYMLRRNRDNDGTPTACTREELMHAIWGDEPLRDPQEISALILDLRRHVELDPASPRFVETVKGIGYRLELRPPAW